MSGRRAVFLDRDGVLNHPVASGGSERPPWSVAELSLVEGAAGATRQLRRAGYLLVAITNQPDIGRRRVRAEEVAAVNRAVAAAMGLDALYQCPHGGDPPCRCRKPEPGMVLAAAEDLDLDLARSWLIGDRWVDIAAGAAAGVRTILVERGGSWAPTSAGPPPPDLLPGATVADVAEAVAVILAG